MLAIASSYMWTAPSLLFRLSCRRGRPWSSLVEMTAL